MKPEYTGILGTAIIFLISYLLPIIKLKKNGPGNRLA
jgi:hypothetical protein